MGHLVEMPEVAWPIGQTLSKTRLALALELFRHFSECRFIRIGQLAEFSLGRTLQSCLPWVRARSVEQHEPASEILFRFRTEKWKTHFKVEFVFGPGFL